MSWGDTFSDAWDSATGAAQAAAETVASTAQAAYDAAYNVAHQVRDAVAGAIDTVVSTVVGLVEWGYGIVSDLFTPHPGGGIVQPCPGPRPGPPGGTVPPGGKKIPGGYTPPDGDNPPPGKDDYNIVSVEWLHGDDVTTIGSCDQYVNLPRDAKWLADSDIPNIDRLGIQPRFLVTFDRPVSAGFQWRIIPLGGDAPDYTATEEGRNGNFVPGSKLWVSGSVSDGKAIVEGGASLVAGGGYTFQVEAKDDKNQFVRTGIITTKRLFWYIELPMSGLANALESSAEVEAEYAKHHIVLKQVPDVAIAHQENINTLIVGDMALLQTNMEAAVSGSAAANSKAPYLLRIAYTDHIADKNPNQRQRKLNVPVGPGQPATEIGVMAQGLIPGDGNAPRSLWNNIVTGEGWFHRAEYTPNGGGAAIPIPGTSISGTGRGSNLRIIRVDVSSLLAGTGTIDVYVDVIDSMAAGLALNAAANICICTRAWWNRILQISQQGVLSHEIGHKIHMVSDGSGALPDQVATFYIDRGHVGEHCYNGCAAGQPNYGTTENVEASICTMFGTSNNITTFCGNCAPAVKKVDLSAGF